MYGLLCGSALELEPHYCVGSLDTHQVIGLRKLRAAGLRSARFACNRMRRVLLACRGMPNAPMAAHETEGAEARAVQEGTRFEELRFRRVSRC